MLFEARGLFEERVFSNHMRRTVRFFMLALWVLGWNSFSSLALGQEIDHTVIVDSTLNVATLNVAHGRRDGFNQIFQSGETARRNLTDVATVLNRIEPHVVALQEADAPSRWSGKFDHVVFLAQASGLPFSFHGHHADTRLYTYGTALLSRYPLADTLAHHFKPSPPTTNKGFVVGTVQWSPGGALNTPLTVHLLSVHLDFSRRSVREDQIEEMIEVLSNMPRPFVILGDFNADWHKEDSAVRVLVEQFDLRVYKPQAEGLHTYGSDRRLDWILLSPALAFARYEVLPDVVSDHRVVVAEVRVASQD